MEKSALAQENVWLDKPSYDKAERLYFERLAKVVSHKITGSSLKLEISVINNDEDNLALNDKTMNDEMFVECDENILISVSLVKDTNSTHQIKTTKLNKYELEVHAQKEKNEEDKELTGTPCKGNVRYGLLYTKNNINETKEKKSKSNTKHKNKKGKNNTEQIKENVTPLMRKEEQLPIQGIQQTISPILSAGGSLANEVAKARQHIKESLQCMDDMAAAVGLTTTPNDNKTDVVDFSVVQELKRVVQKLEGRIKTLEDMIQPLLSTVPKEAICPVKSEPVSKPAAKTTHEKDDGDEDDDDVDLFGSDSEGDDTEAAKLREERLSAYAAKKAKKPALVAKSNIILDVKPWDDETDMKAMEEEVRKIASDGLLWGASKLVPLAYGIHKLQISCVVEDDKISVDWLTEKIQEIEDFVQSVDIAAFNKV